jgi:hypothetical protein
MHAAKDDHSEQEMYTLSRTNHHGRNTGMPLRRRRLQRSNINSINSSSGRWSGRRHGVGAIN